MKSADADLDEWTCPCGHEIDPETGHCIVWSPDSWPHYVPDNRSECVCHGLTITAIEKRWGP